MNQLPFVLLLVLASASASEFLRPFLQFKQDSPGKENLEEFTEPNDLYHEDRSGFFLPRLISKPSPMDEWSSPADFRPSNFVEMRQNRIAGPKDFKVKRTDASLSIVNALDVLRQQIILELARRKMNESKAQIQRNRELLMKTGKRSVGNYDYLTNCGMRNFLTGKRKVNDDLEKEISDASVKSGDENSTTRAHNEIPYQA